MLLLLLALCLKALIALSEQDVFVYALIKKQGHWSTLVSVEAIRQFFIPKCKGEVGAKYERMGDVLCNILCMKESDDVTSLMDMGGILWTDICHDEKWGGWRMGRKQ